MTNTKYPQKTDRLCPECKSPILLMSKIVTQEEGQHNPVTTYSYQCSNKECDDQFKKREKDRKAQVEARQQKRARRPSQDAAIEADVKAKSAEIA